MINFAKRVNRIARDLADNGQSYGKKVFISHIWDEFSDTYDMTRDEFDAALVAANRDDTVVVTRADLITDMDQDTIKASTVFTTGGGELHFVRI